MSSLKYIADMLPYIAFSIPVIIIFRCIYNLHMNQSGKTTTLMHEIGLFLFVCTLVGLASQTIIPKFEILPSGIKIIESSKGGINIIPFKMIYDYIIEVFERKNLNFFINNFFGNLLFFVPIGFFPPLLWRGFSFARVFAFGFLCSLCIEICQLFQKSRWTDIDDIILNTAGCILGYGIYKLVFKYFKNSLENFKIKIL